MPKELNIIANQRVDLEDFEYGTRTFTVDSLRAHVSRLMTGSYRGGFVLEGFRVEIPATLSDNYVTITNGIAIDRAGRLITFEEGNLFLNNPRTSGAGNPNLLETAPKNYIMLEFSLTDSAEDDRAFWDPTFPNASVEDSGGDSVPQPKGKEFNISVPTRKAQTVSIVVSGSGFEDSTDPNKLRIPLAIIPMDVGDSKISLDHGTDTEQANTTILEKPEISTTSDLTKLYCTNTRLFDNSGKIQILRQNTASPHSFMPGPITTISYTSNDRENNVLTLLSGIKSITDNLGYNPIIGDIVQFVATPGGILSSWYLKDGGQYDCRPMFFSFTDDGSALSELPAPFSGPSGTDAGDRRKESRNNRHWSGVALLVDPNTAGDVDVNYPSVYYGQQKAVTVTAPRVENRIKQSQDFFRVLATLMQEMKYGVARTIVGFTTEDTALAPVAGSVLYQLNIVPTANDYVVNESASFSQSLVGSWITIVIGVTEERRQIVEVIGEHVLRVNAAFVGVPSGVYQLEVNFPSNFGTDITEAYVGGFVDTRYTGSLQEVWNARVDQFTGTYSEDLNQRLSANKLATITVGDGVNTHGDFIGGDGLVAACNLAFAKKLGSTIYVREGTYYVRNLTPIEVGPNTTIVGAGKGKTVIKLLGSGTSASTTANYFLLRDYNQKYGTPGPSTASEITCKNIVFKDLTLESADKTVSGDGKGVATWAAGAGYPLITNAPLDSFSEPGVTSDAAPEDVIWLPNWNTDTNTASLVDNFTLDNVHLIGGGRGDFTTGNDTTYSVYIVADEKNFLDNVNQNITFKDCTFDTHQGGTAVLKGCQNVSVTGCTFRNANPTGTDKAPLEGITFASRVDNESEIYSKGTLNSDGDVLISGCKFLGEMFTEGGVLYPANSRGWVTFTPTYLGQAISISDCIFRGDLLGSATGIGDDQRLAKQGSVASARGVVNCSPFDITVRGCSFHTMATGVTTQIGHVTVTDSKMWNTSISVKVVPAVQESLNNFTKFSLGLGSPSNENFWNAGITVNPHYYSQVNIYGKPLETYTKTTIKNCMVSYGNTGVQVGHYPYSTIPTTSTTETETSIEVSNCEFKNIQQVMYFDSPEDYANEINYNWDRISVSGCKITDTIYSVLFKGEIKKLTNDHLAAYENIRLPIQMFVYTNNEHYRGKYDGVSYLGGSSANTNGGAYTFLVGKYVTFSSNVYYSVQNQNGAYSSAVSAAYEVSPVVRVLVGGNLEATDNLWEGCTADTGKVSTALQVDLAGADNTSTSGHSTPFSKPNNINISRNTIRGNSSNSSGVGNGVYIGYAYPEGDFNTVGLERTSDLADVGSYPIAAQKNGVLTDGPHIRPELVFLGNNFRLDNANFGLVSIQHGNGTYNSTDDEFGAGNGYSNFWEWYSADIRDNIIHIIVQDMSLGGSVQYGNNIGTSCVTIDTLNVNSTVAGLNSVPEQTNSYSFLGSCQGGNPAVYIACVDLRRCSRSSKHSINSFTDTKFGKAINVVGNTFNIDGASDVISLPSAISKNLQEVMGFRVSKFPRELNINNNEFIRAPLYIKWSWQSPYHQFCIPTTDVGGGSITSGCKMSVCDNSFTNYKEPTTIDINPAVGFGHGGLSPDPGGGYLSLDFSRNIVSGFTDASPGDEDWETWRGCVRFWHHDGASWLFNSDTTNPVYGLWTRDSGAHIRQDNLQYLWRADHNTLTEIYFRISQNNTTAGFTIDQEFAWPSAANNNSLSVWTENILLLSSGTVGGGLTPYTKRTNLFGLSTEFIQFTPGEVKDFHTAGGGSLISDGGVICPEDVRNTYAIFTNISGVDVRVRRNRGSLIG